MATAKKKITPKKKSRPAGSKSKTPPRRIATVAMPTNAQIKKTSAHIDRLKRQGGEASLKLVKDVFAEVFSDLQLTDQFSLKVFAMKNPNAFYTLAAKLIPIQVTGDGGGPILTETVFR